MVELKALSAAQVSKVAALMSKQATAEGEKPASSKKRAAPADSAPAAAKKPKASPKAPAKPEAKSPKPAAKPAPAKPAAAKTPPAAKKATEAKRASGKRSSSKKGKEPAKEEVRKVERIVDVRVTKVGNVEFLIKWSGLGDKENSWEPEDHILDDSLIDEYMKARLVKMAPPGGKYAPGSSVDVLGEADGFEYSWAPAKVLKVGKGSKHEVEYLDFMDGKSKLVEKDVELSRLRPMQQKAAPPKWKPALGELIEVFEDDCWWEGKMLGVDSKKKGDNLNVMLRVSDEKKSYPLSSARPSCWWSAKK